MGHEEGESTKSRDEWGAKSSFTMAPKPLAENRTTRSINACVPAVTTCPVSYLKLA